MSKLPIPVSADPDLALPAVLARAGPVARFATDEFFSARIGNPHTRLAYTRWVHRFLAWCDDRHPDIELARITPGIAARFIDELAPATSNQRLALAALRRFFDVLVTRHVVLLNPFQSVRGPRRSGSDGKTPEITPDQARQLLASFDTGRLSGLRDRALFGTMAYTGARVGAVTALRLQDFRDHGDFRTFWFREKRGREREVPVRHDLDEWLAAYLAAAGVVDDPKRTPFFRPLASGRDAFEARPLQPWTIRTILKRRLKRAGLPEIISPHSFRAMVVTDLLSQGVSTEHVQFLVGHARPSTTQLYDRRAKKVTRNIVERISV